MNLTRSLAASVLSSCLLLVMTVGCAEEESGTEPAPPATQSTTKAPAAAMGANVVLTRATTEVGCGMCIYDLPHADGCVPAAVINGTPMLVTGIPVDAHGLGLCSEAKNAFVSGRVVGDSFEATEVELQ